MDKFFKGLQEFRTSRREARQNYKQYRNREMTCEFPERIKGERYGANLNEAFYDDLAPDVMTKEMVSYFSKKGPFSHQTSHAFGRVKSASTLEEQQVAINSFFGHISADKRLLCDFKEHLQNVKSLGRD